jgi:hypothetical protein
MALHLEMFVAKGSKALIREIDRESIEIDLLVAPMSIGPVLAMTAGKRRKRIVKRVLAVLTLLGKRAIRRESIVPTESFVPRWVDAEDREAA